MLFSVLDANNAIKLVGDVDAHNTIRTGFDRQATNFTKVTSWEVVEIVVAPVAEPDGADVTYSSGLISSIAELAVAAIA